MGCGLAMEHLPGFFLSTETFRDMSVFLYGVKKLILGSDSEVNSPGYLGGMLKRGYNIY